MRYEIDQSIKIEQTQKDTVIGISNGKSYTILVKRHVKRKLQQEFRKHRTPRLFVYRTFIGSIVLLLKYFVLKNNVTIEIDTEYQGQNKILTSMFYEMWNAISKVNVNIKFTYIGRSSRSHQVSYLTTIGKLKPNKILTYKELSSMVLKSPPKTKLDA